MEVSYGISRVLVRGLDPLLAFSAWTPSDSPGLFECIRSNTHMQLLEDKENPLPEPISRVEPQQ